MIPQRMYEIWEKTTHKILEYKNLPDSSFFDVGLEAWDKIGSCAKNLKPDNKATVAFWISWNDSDLTRKDIADFFIEDKIKENATPDNVRDYLNNARENILKCLKSNYDIEIKP